MSKIGDHDELGHAFESRDHLLLIFQLENILRPDLNFSTFYGRLTDSKSFWGLGEKYFTEIFTYRRGGLLSTPCLDGVEIANAQTG